MVALQQRCRCAYQHTTPLWSIDYNANIDGRLLYVYTCLKRTRNITKHMCYILSVDGIKAKVLLDSCPGLSPSDQGNRGLLNKGSLTLAMGKCLWFSVKTKVCQSSLSSP